METPSSESLPRQDDPVELEAAEGTPTLPGRIPWLLRAVMVFSGSILLTLLILAATLSPNPDGVGTHRQLRIPFVAGAEEGLPACSFLVAFGKPCPSCGMTTSWAWLMKGNLWASASANIGGTLLGLSALAATPWLLVSGLIGRFWPGMPNEIFVIVMALAVMFTTLINWLVRFF
ncbi:MAG: DUF2752 domain-containing protein [Planctomycetales bacterium]|nr:DUF2752 domain-containing protein [Planctomycetales bacterium]